jgi:hypothetical protein
MPWRGAPEHITDDKRCPEPGCGKLHACKQHSWAARHWYERIGGHMIAAGIEVRKEHP